MGTHCARAAAPWISGGASLATRLAAASTVGRLVKERTPLVAASPSFLLSYPAFLIVRVITSWLNFGEIETGEARRIQLPRPRVNESNRKSWGYNVAPALVLGATTP
jgi:hypothetical protein